MKNNMEYLNYWKTDRTIHNVFAEELSFSLIYNNVHPERVKTALETVGMTQLPDQFLLIQVDDYQNQSQSFQVTSEFRQKARIVKLLNALLEKKELSGFVSNLTGLDTVICFVNKKDYKQLDSFISDSMEQIRKTTRYTISVCVSDSCKKLSDYPKQYSIMREILKNSFYTGREQVLYLSKDTSEKQKQIYDSEISGSKRPQRDSDWTMELLMAFRQKRYDLAIRQVCHNLINMFLKDNYSVQEVRVKIIYILGNVEKYAVSSGVSEAVFSKEKQMFQQSIMTSVFLEDMEQAGEEFFVYIAELIREYDMSKQYQFKKPVENYIENHYSEPLQVGTMAKFCGYSDTHFSKMFHREFGQTFSQYLMQKRLEKAIVQLVNGTDTLEEIAVSNGFRSSSYFCRCFRKKYGKTPGEYYESIEIAK